MKKTDTCCFFGSRTLPEKQIEQIVRRLDSEIECLIRRGVTRFISGGTFGFDMIAASLIITKKELDNKIELTLILPSKSQERAWSQKQQILFQHLLKEADKVHILSDAYYDGCVKKRNQYMVNQSDYCICAFVAPWHGAEKIIKYAQQKGVQIVSVID